MRQEDKEVDGPDLEQADESKRENELVEEREDELHDLDGLPETTLDEERSASVVDAMKKILAGEQIVINDLDLSKRHLIALEALKTATEGKDQELSQFVYAEDRRTLLEQSLAVLQPELASLDQLGKPLEALMKEVGDLREKLSLLEDAEEELVEGRARDAVETESDSDDKPAPSDHEDDDRSLTGPARDIEKPPSQLDGPAPKIDKPPTSLTGPERKPEPKGPTTLGDPADLAAAQKGRA